MPLRSLLLCKQPETAQLVDRVFKELSIEVEPCTNPQEALGKLTNQRFEAVVVDDEDTAAAVLVLDGVKSLPSCKRCLGIVLAGPQTSLGVAFGSGTNLVIYKPISADRLRNGLRALRVLMGRRPFRQFPRLQVKIPARLNAGPNIEITALIVELGEGGAALRLRESVPAIGALGLEFVLSNKTNVITTSAEVVWRDVRGGLGVRFLNMPSTCSKLLNEWVAAQTIPKHRNVPRRKLPSLPNSF